MEGDQPGVFSSNLGRAMTEGVAAGRVVMPVLRNRQPQPFHVEVRCPHAIRAVQCVHDVVADGSIHAAVFPVSAARNNPSASGFDLVLPSRTNRKQSLGRCPHAIRGARSRWVDLAFAEVDTATAPRVGAIRGARRLRCEQWRVLVVIPAHPMNVADPPMNGAVHIVAGATFAVLVVRAIRGAGGMVSGHRILAFVPPLNRL
jgi:hypothetical protein